MDRKTIWAILISLTIWFAWLAIFPPPEPAEKAPEDTTTSAPSTPEAPAAAPAIAPSVPARLIDVELCRTHGEVTTATGGLRDWTLLDVEGPLHVQSLWAWATSGFSGPWQPYGASTGQRTLLTDKADGVMAGAGALGAAAPVEVVEQAPGRLVTRAVTADGLEIVRTLATGGAPCGISVEVTWRNGGTAPYTGGVWVAMQDELHPTENRYTPSARPKIYVDGDVEAYDDLEPVAAPELLEGPVGWFGIDDAFFGAYLVPTDPGASGRAAFTSRPIEGGVTHGVHYVLGAPIAAGGSTTARFLLYGGAKVVDELEAAHPLLGGAVELGWFSAIARPLLWLLKSIHAAVGNWGVAIIGLTLLVKLVLFPLTQKSFRSSQEMQALQPKVAELKELHRDNNEVLQRETMKLYQEHGVNPLGGCLPMLVQMPVFFALYSTLQSSVELNRAPFLYLQDLSAPDPYMALPTLVMVLMVVQQQLMPNTAAMDPAQARMMKVMPLIFGIFFYSFPAGLALYTFVNMVLSILQQWYIKQTFRPVGA